MRASDTLHRAAVFEVEEGAGLELSAGTARAFCDPAGIEALRRIAAALRHENYVVSKPKRAKGIEAGCGCMVSSGCEITILLGVWRRTPGSVGFYLITEWYPSIPRSLWPGEKNPDGICIQSWGRLLNALDRACRSALAIQRIAWIRDEQLKEQLVST